jgi:hypothetical protein
MISLQTDLLEFKAGAFVGSVRFTVLGCKSTKTLSRGQHGMVSRSVKYKGKLSHHNSFI